MCNFFSAIVDWGLSLDRGGGLLVARPLRGGVRAGVRARGLFEPSAPVSQGLNLVKWIPQGTFEGVERWIQQRFHERGGDMFGPGCGC